MNTMNSWNDFQNLAGRTLRTLDRHNPFDIVSVSNSHMIVMPRSTEIERRISRAEIENAYNKLMARGELTRSEIRAEFSEFNPAYVAAILAALPRVEFTARPITLRLRNKQ